MEPITEALASFTNTDPSIEPLTLQNIDKFRAVAKDSEKSDDKYPWYSESCIDYCGNQGGLYGKPAVAINIPACADVEVNFVPDLNTKGDLTSATDDEGDTVKPDPFGLKVAPDPRDPQDPLGDAEPGEGDEARYLSLQDLM